MLLFLILILGVLAFGCGEPSDAKFDSGSSDGSPATVAKTLVALQIW